MAQYIDKSAVVAEIERIKKEECPIDTYEGRNKLFYFERFLSFLNTLEVKEVHEEHISEDLEEAANQYAKKAGAQWADKHPDAISMNYLQSWYQCSIDETQEPIWTDKHLEELYEDFYLIPKEK